MEPIAIYENLKEKIIWLEYQPESAFNLTELAEHYGVSRNPVTLALTRLDAEQWVTRNGSHFVVSPLSLNRFREITELRLLMEPTAYVWAMERITPEEIDELHTWKSESGKISSSNSVKEATQVDLKFHQIIYGATKNMELARLLERLLNHYMRFWLSSPSNIDLSSLFDDHYERIDAILTKDEERLRALSINAIKRSLNGIVGSF